MANFGNIPASIFMAPGNAVRRNLADTAFEGILVPTSASQIGLPNVNNTSDASKPVSTATQNALDLKEDLLTAGSSTQYYRGDKSWQTLDKTAVGMGNLDNTSDANKPISTATVVTLATKADSSSLAAVALTGAYNDLLSKPTLFSGSYTDLSNKPTIPSAQVVSDWNASTGVATILNKPSLFSGVYTDLTSRPSLFSGIYSDLTGKPVLAAVATSGSYNDLSNKPVAKRIETYLGSTNSSGNYTITYGTAFAATPDVQPQLQAGTVTQTVRITSSTTTGFTVNVQNRTDVLGLLPSYANVNAASVSVLVTER